MTGVVMRCAALLLLLVVPGRAQDEPTLAQVLDRMEAAVAPARGFTLTSEARSGGSLSAWYTARMRAEFASRADGTVRMRSDSIAFAQVRGLPEMPTGTSEVVLADTGLHLRQESSGRTGPATPLRAFAARFSTTTGAFDPLLAGSEVLPVGKNLLLLYQLAPRRALSLDPDLRLMGRRTVGGQDVHVLVSRRAMPGSSELQEFDPRPSAVVRRVFVGTSDHLVKRVEMRYVSRQPGMNYLMAWWVTGTTDVGGVALPTRVEARWSLGAYEGYTLTFSHEAGAIRREDPGALLADDLYASAALREMAQIEAALAASPDDAELLVSRAIVRSGLLRNTVMIWGMPAQAAPDSAAMAADLERALEKRWAPTPARALMAIHAQSKSEKLEAVLQRVEKDKSRPAALALDAAEHLNDLGKHDRALALLEGLPGVRAAEERIAAQAGRGDAAAFVDALRETLKGIEDPLPWIERLVATSGLVPEASHPKLADALETALVDDRANAPLRLLRLRLAPGVPAAKAAIEHATDEHVHAAAIAILKERVEALTEEDTPAWNGAVAAAAARPALASHAHALRGKALLKAGKRDEAKAAFEAGLAAAPSVPLEIAQQIEDLGDDALTEKACRAYFKGLKGGAQAIGVLTALHDNKGPLRMLARILHASKRHGELYHVLKELELGQGLGVTVFFYVAEGQNEFLKAAVEEAMKDKSELPGLKWLADGISGPNMAMFVHGQVLDAPALLEKGMEWAPDDIDLAQQLVEVRRARGEHKKAAEDAKALLELLAKGKPGPRHWSRDRVQMVLADCLSREGEEQAAREALAKIDLAIADLPAHDLATASRMLVASDQIGKAIQALGRLEDDGYRPYCLLAPLYERIEDYSSAMRCWNRAIEYGHDDEFPSADIMRGGVISSDAAKNDPRKSRERLIRKIGGDYFINHLLESVKDAPVSADEERARKLYAALSGDDLMAREQADAELRKMGPKVCRALKPGLTAGDAEVRSRVRAILTEWAEPR